MLNDLLIFSKIREGDIKTFENVFRLYYAPLCIYATCIIGNADDAEDIVQELFYNIWQKRSEYKILRSFKGYLYGATRNEALQYIEHKEIKERHWQDEMKRDREKADENIQKEIECNELQQLIKEVLASFPHRRCTIFKAHRFENKRYEDIASSLNISVKLVEAEMTKALKALRKAVELYYEQ
jgi:RNA polymerase sigma-70 factor (ECF subfamily)